MNFNTESENLQKSMEYLVSEKKECFRKMSVLRGYPERSYTEGKTNCKHMNII